MSRDIGAALSADGPHQNRVVYRVLTCSCAYTTPLLSDTRRCSGSPRRESYHPGPRDHAAASDALVPESLHLSARRDLAVAGHKRHAERHRCGGDPPIYALGDG